MKDELVKEHGEQSFQQWALVELFGHQRIAGLVSEFEIGGASFVRIDVPRVAGHDAFTKLFGPKAIYSMSFVERDVALAIAEKLQIVPVDSWSVASVTVEAVRRRLEQATLPDSDGYENEDMF